MNVVFLSVVLFVFDVFFDYFGSGLRFIFRLFLFVWFLWCLVFQLVQWDVDDDFGVFVVCVVLFDCVVEFVLDQGVDDLCFEFLVDLFFWQFEFGVVDGYLQVVFGVFGIDCDDVFLFGEIVFYGVGDDFCECESEGCGVFVWQYIEMFC